MNRLARVSTAALGGLALPSGAVAFATPADTTTPRTRRRQARLFPLGTCGCEHVLSVIEDMEPCPDCMEAYDPHDCPLSAITAQQVALAA